MRKYIILWVLVLCFSWCFSAEASTGSLDILINENEEFVFTYAKVADYENGEFVLISELEDSGVELNNISNGSNMKKAVHILEACDLEKTKMETVNQSAHIENLPEGVYLIEWEKAEGYEIPSTLVAVPQWNGEEEVQHHVTVVPKIARIMEPVKTGDETKLYPLFFLCGFSLLIVTGISGRAYFLKDK